MNITTVLFDLDGTLLPMDQDAFTKGYFGLLTQKMAPRGYDPRQLIDAVWAGTAAMVKNDGGQSNETVFWQSFAGLFGEKALADRPLFDEFYGVEFQRAREFCGYQPLAAGTVRAMKAAGVRVALATNPIFPAVGTRTRIRWTGLEPEDFALCTTYENSRYCKPNLNYYRDILAALGCPAKECLMVGNDVAEDMVAGELGMQVFLLTDCLINRAGKDLSAYPHGGFEELMTFWAALERTGGA